MKNKPAPEKTHAAPKRTTINTGANAGRRSPAATSGRTAAGDKGE